jgi:phosphoglycerate dehydrogenase-like enzyme
MHISVWLTNKETQCFNFTEVHKKILQNSINNIHVTVNNNSVSFKESLKNADIAIVWVFKQEWLEIAPKLKWIATPAAGKDYFKINPPKNISITYGSFHGKIMAETLIGMILSASRGILYSYQLQNKIEWPRQELDKSMRSLAGSQITILGFGSIGYEIAKLLKPFRVKIIGIKRKTTTKPDFFDANDKIITTDKINSILPQTDHLVMILPQDKSTDNIINKKRLNLLPKHSFIYNIGRGNSIDEEALINALNNNKIAGAFLDVFKNEPLPISSPLRKCKNILIMPHASALTPDYINFFIEEFIMKYNEWIKKRT